MYWGQPGTSSPRLWRITDCNFDGCSRYSVGVEQGWEYGWINSNHMTNCDTEIAFIATADVNSNAIDIVGNVLLHTSVTVRHALRIEGAATAFITRLVCAQNVIVGGFATTQRVEWGVLNGNVQTSGDFASTDAAWRIFGAVTQCVFTDNLIERTSGASVGPCLTMEKSTDSPTQVRIGDNFFLNDVVGAGFIKVVDCIRYSIGDNLCRSADADVSTMYGIDIQAVTVALTDCLVGPGNQLTAAANSMAAAIHVLANGANVTDISIVGNQGDNCDYGLAREIGGGGGTSSSGQLLWGNNNFDDSAVGDVHSIGLSTAYRVGFNASTFGANLFTGSGSPEGVVTARAPSLYLNAAGGQGTTFYYKESGTGNTGWIGVGGDPIVFGTGDTTVAATAVYFAPGWQATATATELQITMTRPGTIRNLRVFGITAGVTGETNTYTVRKNGVDTTVTTTLLNTATGAASDTTHSFTVVAGDLISISCTKTGVVVGGGALTAVIELA